MTSQSLNNTNYYPVTNNFFSKDQFQCYSTTMSLIHSMNKEKPAHLKEFDRRYANEGNVLSNGNMLFQPNPDLPSKNQKSRLAESQHSQQMSPHQQMSPQQKYDIIVDRASTHQSPYEQASLQSSHRANQNKQIQGKNIVYQKMQQPEQNRIVYQGKWHYSTSSNHD